ncbi:GlcG/HbpS family heme-binding protein [Denitrobaculum tricleocarpae]|uniref:Heme-binding protein n=1 Tax=Denitrobaculum tricleocarpae TaxID=2591009 RepID=A0A545TWM6_9PROT|nr:heme-binding protein [Denitrobaculum tricleocarpae]TQV81619.1 heme-binding protein [Denitrobaculum tricleocarpae]
MTDLTLEKARVIISTALSRGREMELNPLTVAILDAGGQLKALEREDGTSTLRTKIAQGKANGALAVGAGTRTLFKRAQEQPYFVDALNGLADGNIVPVPGGVLIRDSDGKPVGAVGVTGDSSDNDEICAVAGIEAAGFKADVG